MLLSKQIFLDKARNKCKRQEPSVLNTHKVKEEPCESGEDDGCNWL